MAEAGITWVGLGCRQLVFGVVGTKYYNAVEFGLKQTNVHGTSFVNGIMWQQVFVMCYGLYIAHLGMIFCIS